MECVTISIFVTMTLLFENQVLGQSTGGRYRSSDPSRSNRNRRNGGTQQGYGGYGTSNNDPSQSQHGGSEYSTTGGGSQSYRGDGYDSQGGSQFYRGGDNGPSNLQSTLPHEGNWGDKWYGSTDLSQSMYGWNGMTSPEPMPMWMPMPAPIPPTLPMPIPYGMPLPPPPPMPMFPVPFYGLPPPMPPPVPIYM